MTDELQSLIDRVRGIPVSEAQHEAQRRSFAYGNTAIENARITRAMIDRQADGLRETHDGS